MSFFKKNPYPAHVDENLSFGKQVLIFIWEVFKVVVISLAIIIPVRYYLIKPFYVKGASMEPNFYNYEYLIINELSYHLNQPARGDVVVLKYPYDTSEYFIKRVIGLPGERVRIANGQVEIINQTYPEGEILNESYLPVGTKTLGEIDITLGPTQYYVLGDNRQASLDSRAFGPVDRQYIIGKTLFRGWPVSRIGLVVNNIKYGF
jgi:signal peptidase I